jgi:predicted transcriptional regulator
MAPEKSEEAEVVKKKPSIPLKDIVQEKFVICLDSSSTARKK